MTLLTEICTSLAKLTVTDLQKLQSRITTLLDYQETSTIAPQFSEELYQAITHVLKILQQTTPPFSVLKKSRHYRVFLKQTEKLNRFDQQLPANLSMLLRVHFYSYCIQLICDGLKTRDIPLNLSTVISSLHLIPSLIEQAFPGYLASGLLPWVVENLHHS